MKCRIPLLALSSLVLPWFAAAVPEAPAGGLLQAWKQHGDKLGREPGLARHYTFQEVKPGEHAVPNAAGDPDTPLQFQSTRRSGEPAEALLAVEGRWPEKKGVRLDPGWLAGPPVAVPNRSFSATAWVKLHGPGSLRGNNDSTNGTLLSCGSGYWDGWRLTVSYPARTLGFEMGRPKPSHSVGIHAAAAVADGVWHHLAAVWDGREMRLYVDGVLAGSGTYEGDYTPPGAGAQFRIGYANHGIGSVVWDVDEVTVHRRAVSEEEIQRALEFCGAQAPGARRNLARLCSARGDFAGARAHYQGLLEASPAGGSDRLNTLFELGHASWQAGDPAGARAAYARVVEAKDAPAHFRSAAQLCIAASHERRQEWVAAKAELAKIAGIAGAAAHHRHEAAERAGEIARLEQGLPARAPAGSRSRVPQWPEPALSCYVAPAGDDTNPGTLEKPFATLERARDEIRARRKAAPGAALPGGAAVWVRGGDHSVTRTFKLSAGDSGTEAAPIRYIAFGQEEPRFTGAARIGGFSRVVDPAVLARLPEEARGEVWQADLKGQGIRDLGTLGLKGSYGARRREPLLDVFFDGRPLELARWPNDGFVTTGEVLGLPELDKRGRPHHTSGQFRYAGDRPARWKDETDAWLYGYWFHDWADSYEKIAAIDPARRLITLAPPLHSYGFAPDRRYHALNLLAEIDRPGEWYLDRGSGVLYLWPPADPNRAKVEVSMLAEPFVELDGVAHVAFRGLTWEMGRSDGLRIRSGESCLLAGCTVRNLAGDGVVVDGGKGHGLLSCDMHHLGRGGAMLRGGDRKTLTSGGHFLENCHLHHLSRIDHTYTPAALVQGVGIRIAHNRMHHIGSSAMRIEGNDHLVEFNEVHDVVRESDDQGAVDVFGNPTFRGVVYRHNFFHDIGSGRACGQAGIRLDDGISGTLIYGNIFWRCADGNFGGVQIHGGKDNIVDNNLFVECRQAISFSPWGPRRWEQFLAEDHGARSLQEVDITRPPYSTRYPELDALRANPDANHIWRNLAIRCGQFAVRDRGVNEFLDNHTAVAGHGHGREIAASADIRRLACDAALERLSFDPIPVQEIGLYADPLRAKLPSPD